MYEDLYEQNKGLIVTMARQYAAACEADRAVSVEDLVHTGFIAVVDAAQTYDPSGGRSWTSWAAWQIRKAFDQELGMWHGRFLQPHSGAESLDRVLGRLDAEGTTRGELLTDVNQPEVDDGLLTEELCRGVREAVDRLEDPDQRLALRLCRLEERSVREAAAAMGVSEQRVRRLNQRAGAALARDWQLRRLADLDERTCFHAHKGVAAFNRDWTSVTESTALWRIEQEKRTAPQED